MEKQPPTKQQLSKAVDTQTRLLSARQARLTSLSPPQTPKPSSPLCCPSALPHTTRYLAVIIPATSLPPYRSATTGKAQYTLATVLTPFLFHLALGTEIQHASSCASLPTFNPFTQIIQVSSSTPAPNEDEEVKYYGLVTGEKMYFEVTKWEAEISLKMRGSGAENIGDGETWNQMQGEERFFCEGCGVWVAFKAWVREE